MQLTLCGADSKKCFFLELRTETRKIERTESEIGDEKLTKKVILSVLQNCERNFVIRGTSKRLTDEKLEFSLLTRTEYRIRT